jgi:hypothetical protein
VQLIGLLRNAPLDLVSVIDDFGTLIYAEIDYDVEAANAARFSRLYSQLPNVTAPSIFLPLSTAKVLTMQWVDGARLTSLTCDPADDVRSRHPLAPPCTPLHHRAPPNIPLHPLISPLTPLHTPHTRTAPPPPHPLTHPVHLLRRAT